MKWKLVWQKDLEAAATASVGFMEAVCAVGAISGDLELLKSATLVSGPDKYSLCSLGAAFG